MERPVSPTFPALRPGDRIAVIAPSSPFDEQGLLAGVEFLRAHYEVQYDPSLFSRTGYLAGGDARRALELNQALADPQVRGILAARGGYGATRLLPLLDFAALQTAPKLLVGFSDITALHAQWQRHGQCSLHASMVSALGSASPEQQARLLAALAGQFRAAPLTGLVGLTAGRARGALCGGNLAVLCSLLGTPYAPPFEHRVLFLEDVGERPYRVDRMLTTLRLGGYLDQVAAIAVGAFTEAVPGPDGICVEHVLRERLSDLNVPVVMGIPAGHLADNLELPLGMPVDIDADRGTLDFI